MTKHSELIERLKYLAEGYEMDDPEALREAITALSQEPVQSEEVEDLLAIIIDDTPLPTRKSRIQAADLIKQLAQQVAVQKLNWEESEKVIAADVLKIEFMQAQIKEYDKLCQWAEHQFYAMSTSSHNWGTGVEDSLKYIRSQRAAMTGEDDETS